MVILQRFTKRIANENVTVFNPLKLMVSKTRLPDGSQAPQWLQKMQYARNSIAYMEKAAQRYGDIFNAPVFGNHPVVLFISHPQALQRVFATDTKQIIAPPNQFTQPIVGDNSILTMGGSRHRRERRLLMPPFHGERMQSYGQLICELVDKAMSSLAIGAQFSARQLAQEISLEVILKAVFGIGQEERFKRLKSLLINFTDSLQSPLIGGMLLFPSLQQDWGSRSPWGYVRSLQRQIRELVQAEVDDRRNQNYAGSDILSLLMSAHDEAGQPISDAELHDELITLLFAGQDPTATAIAWGMYWIHRHPLVGEKLLRS